ncbi:MAG: protein kinase [Pirellulales bacterium]|nr:protein kinase [Pirellulales bacterium]
MSTDPTQTQGGYERRVSREMSLKRGRPPTQVPGYEPERLLGNGAYGEVWVAIERNTGRRVAIKFYAHRGGLDWSLLSREVEKLAFLFADRYVVQLLGVGWNAEPPYYIMEYLERGSLADRLQHGPLPVDEAVELFRDVAVGLVHAHGKGVLHCDLKPANILLDEDNKPRLADFGQSRLSYEQMPALGTMFYMAPEQADLDAVPDARWDVYALGALFYCMLTGHPPHHAGETADEFERTPDLRERLSRYREMIERSPIPLKHRNVPGVDAALADIIDRCLTPDPRQRYPNVQAVLDALDARAARRARRPMMVLGAIGPALLLAVVSWFAWQGFHTAMKRSDRALTAQALKSNQFAAQFVARAAAYELERRYQQVEDLAGNEAFRRTLLEVLGKPDFRALLAKLADPNLPQAERDKLRKQFRDNPDRLKLQKRFASLIPPALRPREEEEVASWFFCDAGGVSTVRVPEGKTIGRDYAWRSFFHGGPKDLEQKWRPEPGRHITATTLSAVFRSQATSKWIVAISTPVLVEVDGKTEFLGIVAMTVEVGRLVELRGRGRDQSFAVLVDDRDGDNKGLILQHPLIDKMLATRGELPDRFNNYRLKADDLPDVKPRQERYRDPLAADPDGGTYNRRWLAQMEPVTVRKENTGWLVIVQEDYNEAIGGTLSSLADRLLQYGLTALVFIAVVMAVLWAWATRMSVKRG